MNTLFEQLWPSRILTSEFRSLSLAIVTGLETGKTHLPSNNCKLKVRVIFLHLYKKYPGKGQ